MEFNQEQNINPNYIRKYIPNDNFLIDEKNYYNSIAIYKDQIIENWITQNNIDNLNFKNIQKMLDQKPDIFILGTGEKQIFPKPDILKYLSDNKITCEIMNTNAACRTFNILQQENRNVLAALIL